MRRDKRSATLQLQLPHWLRGRRCLNNETVPHLVGMAGSEPANSRRSPKRCPYAALRPTRAPLPHPQARSRTLASCGDFKRRRLGSRRTITSFLRAVDVTPAVLRFTSWNAAAKHGNTLGEGAAK